MSEEVKKKVGKETSSPIQGTNDLRSGEASGLNFKKKFVFKKKECYFTKNKISHIDYKDVDLLKRFIGRNGRILPRRFTGTTALFQRKLSRAIKKARAIALLPYVGEVEYNRKKIDRSDKNEKHHKNKSVSHKQEAKPPVDTPPVTNSSVPVDTATTTSSNDK